MQTTPFHIKALASFQIVFGALVTVLGTYTSISGLPDDLGYLPRWLPWLIPFVGLATIWAAIQLWKLRWRGPIATLVLWLLPFVASLPFATVEEILTDSSFIEGRIIFLLVYAVIVFEYRK